MEVYPRRRYFSQLLSVKYDISAGKITFAFKGGEVMALIVLNSEQILMEAYKEWNIFKFHHI